MRGQTRPRPNRTSDLKNPFEACQWRIYAEEKLLAGLISAKSTNNEPHEKLSSNFIYYLALFILKFNRGNRLLELSFVARARYECAVVFCKL